MERGFTMNQELRDYVAEKSRELMNAPSCSREAREAAQAWLDAVGTDREEEQTKKYIAELEQDIVTVDGLAAFAESERHASACRTEQRGQGQLAAGTAAALCM